MIDSVIDSGFSLFKRTEGLIQFPFLFENSIDPFSQGIFVGVAVLGHTDFARMQQQNIHIGF